MYISDLRLSSWNGFEPCSPIICLNWKKEHREEKDTREGTKQFSITAQFFFMHHTLLLAILFFSNQMILTTAASLSLMRLMCISCILIANFMYNLLTWIDWSCILVEGQRCDDLSWIEIIVAGTLHVCIGKFLFQIGLQKYDSHGNFSCSIDLVRTFTLLVRVGFHVVPVVHKLQCTTLIALHLAESVHRKIKNQPTLDKEDILTNYVCSFVYKFQTKILQSNANIFTK